MKVNTELWNEYASALDTLAKIETRLALAQDGQQPHGKITNRLQAATVLEGSLHVLIRNLFPFATDDQVSALGALWSARRAMSADLESKAVLSQPEMDIQHNFEVCKARVRHCLPLDEISELQRYYIENVLFKVR